MLNGNMSSIRASFMIAFERWYGSRPEKVTRKDLDDFMKAVPPGHLGPSGQALKYPSWLTNGDMYRAGRGEYAMPWTDLDAFLKVNPNVTPATQLRKTAKTSKSKTTSVAPAAEPAAEVAPETV